MATEWVLLPVPQEDYAELRQMVEYRQLQRGEAPSPSMEELSGDDLTINMVRRVALDRHKAWPVNALQRLSEGATLTAQRWTTVMDLCAQSPEEMFSTEEVSAKTGIPINAWRDACRKVGAHLRKHYPEVPKWEHEPIAGAPMWPLVTISGRNLKVPDQLYVGITAEQANRWTSVR